MNTSHLLTPVLALTATFAVNAQIWVEVGDAGPLPATAQVPAGVGALNQIDGALSAGPGEDMYKIYIADPANFSATTEPDTVGTLVDTQLFLFDANGNGITHNDDTPVTPGFRSTLTSQFIPLAPGHYYIAVSPYNNDPTSGAAKIWNDTPFDVERQPDGPAAAGVVDGWDRSGGGNGTYTILLTGCEYPDPLECFLMLGLNQWNYSLGNDPILVEPMLVVAMSLTNLPSIGIPNNNGLIGLPIYAQSLLYNPGVFPQDPIKTSEGLNFRIGVSTTQYGSPSGMLIWPTGQQIVQPGSALSIAFSIQ